MIRFQKIYILNQISEFLLLVNIALFSCTQMFTMQKYIKLSSKYEPNSSTYFSSNLCLKKKCKIALLTKVSQAKSTSFFEVSPFFTRFPSLLIHWHFKSFFHLITSCLNLHELESTKFYLIYLCTSLTRIAMLCVHIYQVVPGNVFAFSFSTCLHVPKEFSGLYINYAGGHP